MPRTGTMKDGLHLMQHILKDVSHDVGTQTFDIESETNKSNDDGDASSTSKAHSFTKGYVPNINLTTARSSQSPKFKSSFRLFIVPEGDGVDESSGLKLSLEDSNSFRFSVTRSSNDECFETATSNYICRKPPWKFEDTRTPNVLNRVGKRKDKNLRSTPSVNRDNFATDHQLIHSTNPSVVAWLKMKNFEDKQKRKQRRREKKELRRAERVEAEKKKEREEESKKRFTQWLVVKRREAKRTWREANAKIMVNPLETKQEVQNEDTPPPNYTVVPSFKGSPALDESLETLTVEEAGKTVTPKNLNGCRDKTLKTQDKIKRPRTSGSVRRRTSTIREHAGIEVRPNTASRRQGVESGTKDGEGSRRITFEDWMERKRRESKEKAKQRKQESVDEALADGILKVARKRVENILQGKKNVETGIPKWRAKNRVGSLCGDTSPSTRRQYVLAPDLLGNETCPNTQNVRNGSRNKAWVNDAAKDNHGAPKEVKATQQLCESLKLDSSEIEFTAKNTNTEVS